MERKDYRIAEEHVRMCEECQREVSELRETLVLLDKFQPPPLSKEFKESVRLRLYKMPSPSKPLSWKIKEWLQIRPVKWTLEGLAAVAVILLTLTIYKGLTPEKPQEVEKIPRELKITLTEAKNPIIIETEDIDHSLEQMKKLIYSYNGQVLQIIQIEKGVKVTFSLEKEKEPALLIELNKLGKVQMEKEGYKDKEGNIVIVIKQN